MLGSSIERNLFHDVLRVAETNAGLLGTHGISRPCGRSGFTDLIKRETPEVGSDFTTEERRRVLRRVTCRR